MFASFFFNLFGVLGVGSDDGPGIGYGGGGATIDPVYDIGEQGLRVVVFVTDAERLVACGAMKEADGGGARRDVHI